MNEDPDDLIREAYEAMQELKHPVLADDVLICECFCLSLGDIRAVLTDSEGIDIEYLQRRLHLGTGCGSCLKRREEWFGALKAPGQ